MNLWTWKGTPEPWVRSHSLHPGSWPPAPAPPGRVTFKSHKSIHLKMTKKFRVANLFNHRWHYCMVAPGEGSPRGSPPPLHTRSRGERCLGPARGAAPSSPGCQVAKTWAVPPLVQEWSCPQPLPRSEAAWGLGGGRRVPAGRLPYAPLGPSGTAWDSSSFNATASAQILMSITLCKSKSRGEVLVLPRKRFSLSLKRYFHQLLSSEHIYVPE